MIGRNVDVIAISLILIGVAIFSSLRDSGLAQAASSHHRMVAEHIRDAVMRRSLGPPVRYRYY